jgi:hypothetical protein
MHAHTYVHKSSIPFHFLFPDLIDGVGSSDDDMHVLKGMHAEDMSDGTDTDTSSDSDDDEDDDDDDGDGDKVNRIDVKSRMSRIHGAGRAVVLDGGGGGGGGFKRNAVLPLADGSSIIGDGVATSHAFAASHLSDTQQRTTRQTQRKEAKSAAKKVAKAADKKEAKKRHKLRAKTDGKGGGGKQVQGFMRKTAALLAGKNPKMHNKT